MRHHKKGRKLGLKRGPRKAFLKILANNLIQKEKISTTEGRAKELKPFIERLVTLGKRQNLASLRLLLKKLPKAAAYKLYNEIAPRYLNRRGGYTRIIKLSKKRTHDGSKMATIEFVA
jgi:large subunit ribosomal protein L17